MEPITPAWLHGKRVTVLGAGISGVEASRLLLHHGAGVRLSDARPEAIAAPRVEALAGPGFEADDGPQDGRLADGCDLMVISPGVPLSGPAPRAALARGVPLVGELELAWMVLGHNGRPRPRVVAVTGTNGKSTVVELLAVVLNRVVRRAWAGGNLGTPLSTYALEADRADVLALEVSSFQLDLIHAFRPEVAVVLNVAEDHLDRYPSLSDYAAAKFRLWRFQTPDDALVYNHDDPLVREAAVSAPSERIPFSRTGTSEAGLRLTGDRIEGRVRGIEISIDLARATLTGDHNRENMLAVAAAASLCGVCARKIQEGFDAFRPLRHRVELVHSDGGIDWFDDSKGTNVHSVVAALSAFDRPVVLIAGGRDKGGDYAPLVRAALSRVRQVILIGEAAEAMRRAFDGRMPVVVCGGMPEAVAHARQAARSGDAVLLSPACSSFDMYPDYKARGDHFRALAREESR